MHRLQPFSTRKGSELAWEARLPSVKSSGSAMPIISLLDVLNVPRLHLPDSGEMGAIRHGPQPSCSMWMSRRSLSGARRGAWRVFVLHRWDHAGLRSPPRSSRSCASPSSDNGSTETLVMLAN